MRWIWRSLAAVALLLALGVGALLWFGPAVNAPLAPMLAARFPEWFDAPQVDIAQLQRQLIVAPGFSLSLFATGLPDARMLRALDNGDLLLASPSQGVIWRLAADSDGDGASDGIAEIARGLSGPNGMDVRDGWLYVAEGDRVRRARFDGRALAGDWEVVIADLPAGGNHWKKTIRFGPDGLLYLAVGSSCNVCVEADPRRAALLTVDVNTRTATIFATGLRNSAGFDWRPHDGALFATDNGRDLLGDDFPPCELNEVVAGGFYGWPFANGGNVADPDLGAGRESELMAALPPVFDFAAHNAPLGIVFPRPGSLPDAFDGAALVALHGSWNRSQKDGYKVVSLHWLPNGQIESRDFVAGFLKDDRVIGRPAEIAQGSDGAIYFSDDFSGTVYRVAYGAGDRVRPLGKLPAVATAQAVDVAVAPGVQSKDLLVRGKDQFAAHNCAECHSAANLPRLDDGIARFELEQLAARYNAQSLAAYLEHPQPPMPPVADAEQRAALAEYLLTEFD